MSRGNLKLDLSHLDMFCIITSMKWFKKLFTGEKIYSLDRKKRKNVNQEQVRVHMKLS